MKKLLTLAVLVAGVALFAGCMNKPETVEDVDTTTPTVDTTTPAVDDVVPATDLPATGTEEVIPTPTAE